MSAIELQSISYAYTPLAPLLEGVSLDINQGETWAVIGKNGCGKSTLLKCIAGLLDTTAGSILINGRLIGSLSPKERAHRIAYVPQAGGRGVPPYPVSDFVMLGRFPYQGFLALPGEQDREIVRSVLRLTDTITLAERSMNTLSGGELQRVFIAAAVAQKTEILLLDEPMSFLDPLHQELVNRSLQRIHDEFNTTLITITHDVNFALRHFSHLCALKDGKTFFKGTSEQFRTNACELLRETYAVTFSEISNKEDGRRYFVPQGVPE